MSVWSKPRGFRRIAELLSWGVYTEYVINDLLITHEGPYTEKEKDQIAGYVAATGWVFGGRVAGQAIISAIGWGTVGTVLGAFYVGKYASQVIDPDQGKENYYGFLSGGYYGNDPNYLTGDEQATGYFNMYRNMNLIISSYATDYNTPPPTNLQASELKGLYWSPRAKTWVANEEEADIVVAWMYEKGLTSYEEQFYIANGAYPWEL
jgi:hypothetical protein